MDAQLGAVDPRHAVGIDGHGLGPAEVGHHHHHEAHRFQMVQGVQADAAHAPGRVVPQPISRQGVAALMDRDGDQRRPGKHQPFDDPAQVDALKPALQSSHVKTPV